MTIISVESLRKKAKQMAREYGMTEKEAYDSLVKAANKKGYTVATVIEHGKQRASSRGMPRTGRG